MRKIFYILLICAVFFVPLQRVEIENLLPVRAIAVYKSGENITVEVDSGLKASDRNVAEAVKRIKEESPAIIYLKTAVYLFVSDDVTDIDGLDKQLKRNVKIYRCNASGRVAEMVEYLDAHGELTNLHE
ncbi:MAG: hypothetical protein IKU07_04055 [Oscillospiraceae bacterium]|nr:hypothetical protein [Oscillospiraceae bacterium]